MYKSPHQLVVLRLQAMDPYIWRLVNGFVGSERLSSSEFYSYLYICVIYWPAPPSIHSGLEWPQSLNRLIVLCSLSANFLIFLLLILLFYSTVSSVIYL